VRVPARAVLSEKGGKRVSGLTVGGRVGSVGDCTEGGPSALAGPLVGGSMAAVWSTTQNA